MAVISAFALNNWNDNRKDRKAESKILLEIRNGLEKDDLDIRTNMMGHQQGMKSCKFWRQVISNEMPNLDTLQHYYFILVRDFVSIQNSSGYETLKSKGFELIANDSLRMDIISLYEFDYQILRKLEEDYHEQQFQENYYYEINKFIAPHFQYDSNGDIIGMQLPIDLEETDRKILLSYLWKIEFNRKFIMELYQDVLVKIEALKNKIEMELK